MQKDATEGYMEDPCQLYNSSDDLIEPLFGPKDPMLAMEINKKDIDLTNEHTQRDNYQIIHEDQSPDEILTNFNYDHDIIICVPDLKNIIKRESNGSLTICANSDINLSGCRIIANNFAALQYRPTVKIIHPKNLKLNFTEPFRSSFHNKIYYNMKQEFIGLNEELKIPRSMIVSELDFWVYIDMEQLKKINRTIVLPKNKGVVGIEFIWRYFPGSSYEHNYIDNLYEIRNPDVYDSFTKFLGGYDE